MGMILALSHQMIHRDKEIRIGHFAARHAYIGSEMADKTIRIIGLGRIGQLIVQKCVYSFNMNILVYDPYVKETELDQTKLVQSVDGIYKHADFITLYLPYILNLHHFINEAVFKKMKQPAYIINCTRGGLIDVVALNKPL